MNVTRDVVIDLWPLYASGEASADTRALVESFLHRDPALARTLAEQPELPAPAFALPPNAEVRAFTRTRALLQGGRWLRSLRLIALALTGLALLHSGKYVEALFRAAKDLPGVEAPTRPMAEAIAAAGLWIAYVALAIRHRRRALRI